MTFQASTRIQTSVHTLCFKCIFTFGSSTGSWTKSTRAKQPTHIFEGKSWKTMKNRHTHTTLYWHKALAWWLMRDLIPCASLFSLLSETVASQDLSWPKPPPKKILQIISKLFLKYRVQSSNRPFCDQTFQHRLKVGNSNELRLWFCPPNQR